ERVARVRETLERIAATPPPPFLPRLEARRFGLMGWRVVAAVPEPFLGLGMVSRDWLEAALPALLAAEQRATLEGVALVHLDVRSDNLCFAGERVVLVDWNWACIGNPLLDVAAWLPSLAAEGGPSPQTILPEAGELVALLAGYWAARAGEPDPWPGARVRQVQRAQLC